MLPCLHLLLLNRRAVAYDLPGESRYSITLASVSTSVELLIGFLKFVRPLLFRVCGLDVPT